MCKRLNSAVGVLSIMLGFFFCNIVDQALFAAADPAQQCTSY
jgi:hypothetical protein